MLALSSGSIFALVNVFCTGVVGVAVGVRSRELVLVLIVIAGDAGKGITERDIVVVAVCGLFVARNQECDCEK